MSKTTFKASNAGKPAPHWWRKLENGLLMILIPSVVAMLMGWGFDDESRANRVILLINTGLVAVIKFVGVMLANGDEYLRKKDEEEDEPANSTQGTGGDRPPGPPIKP